MNCLLTARGRILAQAGIFLAISAVIAAAQQTPPKPREFRPGTLNRIADLPAGRFRTQLERLPGAAQQRALGWLRGFHFTELDLDSLQIDWQGGILYADVFPTPAAPPEAMAPPSAALVTVPVSPFPASLVFHSRPGAPNVLYLNFCGETVSNTAWNSSLGRTAIPAVAFSTDADFSTFNDSEQTAIKRVWERVAEDYASFNIDVTTDRPATFGSRAAHALITRNTDANGDNNPSYTAGGVAYVSVFAGGSYSTYRPAWIYFNKLANTESYIAEAVSHEIGHNLGLSHDGTTSGSAYYGGHGSGQTSWGPIMGTGYNRNVSQWSKGEYYLANNTQDDLAVIAGKLSYRADDHGATPGTATPLTVTGGTNFVSTTPETDPDNTNPANKGVLESNTDVDVFSFETGTGPINLAVNPWIMAGGTRGGNVDVLLELRDNSGALVATNNAANLTAAQIQASVIAGTYCLYVRNSGTGNPLGPAPGGYTPYASVGQYFISGYVEPSSSVIPIVQLTATVNNPAWGTVSPTNGLYAGGASIQITATPAAYDRFVGWTGDATGTNNPLSLVLNTNASIQAVFGEGLTTSHPTPWAWLANYGYTNNWESAVTNRGANGMLLWQSYIAGLVPTNPASQLRLSLSPGSNPTNWILQWNTVTGRVYTVWRSTNLVGGFTPLDGATNLPATVQSVTNGIAPGARTLLYRLQVEKP